MTVALALAAGIVSQSIARHLRVPGIMVLLLVGVVLGPDVAGAVQPRLLGDALEALVGFAVAVILFEGALNLDLERLRRSNRAIRKLVLYGAVVTTAGAALCARLVLAWPWRTCWLFGTLVMVTGPTVITPLVRRFRLEHTAATVLEAEGVLIDAVGAVVAAVALEVALSPTAQSFAFGLVRVPVALTVGLGLGVIGGFGMALALRVRGLVPEGLENVFTLALVLALFQTANAVQPESGIAAAMAAGLVIGNRHVHVHRELLEFKEQLTVLFIGMLFVLLAADVRVSEVRALGWPGLLTVGLLILVVRPLTVLVGTYKTDLSWRQRTLVAAIGPRGIVAAAVSAFFAAELRARGIGGGDALRALVFLVIVVTVVSAGLIGGPLAYLLRLRRPSDHGWLVLGANELARTMARVLASNGQEVICIDTNPDVCKEAEREGLRVIFGNGLRESTLLRAEVDTRAGAVALSSSTEVNVLFMQSVQREGKLRSVYVGTARARAADAVEMIHKRGGQVLFAHPEQLDLWPARIRRGLTEVRRVAVESEPEANQGVLEPPPDGACLLLALQRGTRIVPVGDELRLKRGDVLHVLVFRERMATVAEWLGSRGLSIEPAVLEPGNRPAPVQKYGGAEDRRKPV